MAVSWMEAALALVWGLSLMMSGARGSNTTANFLGLDEEQLMRGRFLGPRKQPKFLSFQTTDNSISVELQLSVPFLTIPVKKTVDAATGMVNNFPPANINLAAIGLAGAVVGGAVFVLPSLLRLASPDSFDHVDHGGHSHPHYRGIDVGGAGRHLSRALASHGAPPGACTQRALCSLVRRSKEATEPTSTDKIVDGLATNEWLQKFFHGTIVTDAITAGQGEQSCAARYPECRVSPRALQTLANGITNKLNEND